MNPPKEVTDVRPKVKKSGIPTHIFLSASEEANPHQAISGTTTPTSEVYATHRTSVFTLSVRTITKRLQAD